MRNLTSSQYLSWSTWEYLEGAEDRLYMFTYLNLVQPNLIAYVGYSILIVRALLHDLRAPILIFGGPGVQGLLQTSFEDFHDLRVELVRVCCSEFGENIAKESTIHSEHWHDRERGCLLKDSTQ